MLLSGNKIVVFLLIISSFSSITFGQKTNRKAFSLGKKNEFFSKLKRKDRDSTLLLKISEKEDIAIKINLRKRSADSETFIGQSRKNPETSFHLTINSDNTNGAIIDRAGKMAYKIYSDRTGNTFIEDTDINQLLCVDYETKQQSSGLDSIDVQTGLSADSDVYSLQSLSSAKAVVYLDFNGQYVSGTLWNNGNPIDAAPSGMSDEQVREIWELVSEDYRPFNVNITTDESIYLSAPAKQRIRCIITPTNTAAPDAGGVAYVGSFTWGNETPCWVFNHSTKSAGEACSHEIGHSMGLRHDGRTNPAESYYLGQGTWAPIMGAGYYKSVSQWSKGEYNYASNLEDDLTIISTKNGFTYRTDDYGNLKSSAHTLITETGNIYKEGVIERTNDVDVFMVSTSGGQVNLTFSPAQRHGNLNLKVTLKDASDNIIISSNPTGLSAYINSVLKPGNYYIYVEATGEGDPLTTGYSSYASLGSYSFSGTLPPPVIYRLPENPVNTVNGINYSYFEGSSLALSELKSLIPIKTGILNSISLSNRNSMDNYAFSYTGYIFVPQDAIYTFFLLSAGIYQFQIGDSLIVSQSVPGGETSGSIALKAGKHAFTLLYSQLGTESNLDISYSGGGIIKQTLPSSALYRENVPVITGDPFGISEEKVNGNVLISPNPSSGEFDISLATSKDGTLNIIITDVSGRLVFNSSPYLSSGKNKIHIDVSSFNKGLYLIRLQTGEAQTFFQKILLQ